MVDDEHDDDDDHDDDDNDNDDYHDDNNDDGYDGDGEDNDDGDGDGDRQHGNYWTSDQRWLMRRAGPDKHQMGPRILEQASNMGKL